jgi:endonuclease YncB( thermonuclease family)
MLGRFLVVAALVLVPSLVFAQLVERIVDGDTLVVSGLGTVRLIGVDTPESVDPRRPVEAYSKEATQFLTNLALGKTVKPEFDVTRTDRFGRTLAYLYLENGTLVNREIIRRGFGHAYVEFPFKYLDEFRRAEQEARGARVGLWAEQAPTDPTDPIVFITRTGTKYHRVNCRTLRESRYEIRLGEATRKYTACDVCSPPAVSR